MMIRLLLLLVLFLLQWNLLAQTILVYSPMPLLDWNTHAQSSGMGEIGVVAGPDYYHDAIWQNPALLTRGKQIRGINANYFPLKSNYLNPSKVYNTGFFYSLNARTTIAFGVQKYPHPKRTIWYNNFRYESADVSDYQMKLSFSKLLFEGFSVGLSLSFIHIDVDDMPRRFPDPIPVPVNTLQVDVGAHYQKYFPLQNSRLRIQAGISFLNMGPAVKFFEIGKPTSLISPRVGVMLGWESKEYNVLKPQIDLAYQARYVNLPGSKLAHQVGTEIRFGENRVMAAFRLGYLLNPLNSLIIAGRPIYGYGTVGLGLGLFRFRLDGSITIHGENRLIGFPERKISLRYVHVLAS